MTTCKLLKVRVALGAFRDKFLFLSHDVPLTICWKMAGKVTAGLAESNGSLSPGIELKKSPAG